MLLEFTELVLDAKTLGISAVTGELPEGRRVGHIFRFSQTILYGKIANENINLKR